MPNRSSEDAQTFFDQLAPAYDSLTAAGAWTPNDYLSAELERINLDPALVLDLGTGTGQTMQVLYSRFPDAHLYGVDASPRMVSIARSKFSRAVIECNEISTFNLPNGHDKVDLLTAIGCLEFLPELPHFLNVVPRFLSRDSYVVLTFEPLVPGYSSQADRRSTSQGSQSAAVASITTYRWLTAAMRSSP